MVTAAAHASYDEMPYEGGLVVGSHPEHLATVGRLFGMTPAPIERCRVLEIGCATGMNLLAMAYSLAGCEFVGIDPSGRQIELGRKALAESGITNVELATTDVREAVEWQREFDYIVCHGVFSWVAPDVQEAILAACRRLLAPQGIAFISYNTLPGFHMRAPVGEMLRFHSRNFPEPGERTDQAGALLKFLVESSGTFAESDEVLGIYHRMLKREKELLDGAPPSYLMHEHLEDLGKGFYLHEFVDAARARGLQYLGDAAFHTMLVRDLPEAIAADLNRISPNQVALEQYRDFVVNRMFRKSLLCRDDVVLERHISEEAIRSLSFRARLARNAEPPWLIPKTGGLVARVSDPRVTAVIEALDAAEPAAPSFAELSALLSGDDGVAAEDLPAILLSLYALDAVEFRSWAPPVGMAVPERAEAFLPARMAAQAGKRDVPVPFHNSVVLDPFICRMLPLVDGSRDRDALAAAMGSIAAADSADMPAASGRGDLGPEQLARLVDEALEQLLRAGLLVD